MKKLNIGLFMDSYLPKVDGVAIVMHNYALELSKHHNVTLFVPGDKKDNKFIWPYRVVRCKLFVFKKKSYGIPIITKKFKKIVRETKLDIIHSHSPFMMGKFATKVAKEKNIPLVSTLHTQFKRDFLKHSKSKIITHFLVKKVVRNLNQSDMLIALNEHMRKLGIEYGYKGKSTTINNGTDLLYPDNALDCKKYIDETYDLKDKKVLLFIGRMINLKNIFFILDVFREINKEDKNVRLVYVGDGPDFNNLKSKIKKYNLQDYVIQTGKIMDREILKKFYLRADLFMFPSLYDADSLVQREAAAMKTPSVFIEGAITTSTINHMENGFIFKNDLTHFKNETIKLLNDQKLIDKVGQKAHDTVGRHWSEIVYGPVMNLYEDLLSNKKNVKK